MFELKIVATGEVRDAAGNLVEQIPIEQSHELTQEQVAALIDGQAALVERGDAE